MQDLFTKEKRSPLAERMRPRNLDEFVGQNHLLGENGPIQQALQVGEISSSIFWGPPGTGKTTLARIIAKVTGCRFTAFSAVLSGVNDVRRAIAEAKVSKKRTVLFIDEIHRFNKAQQDAFLPYVEDGTIILIGVTTENPSFEVIPPLLSRTSVYVFYPLAKYEIKTIIDRAIIDERGLKEYNPDIPDDVRNYIAEISGGDARIALNILEFAVLTAGKKVRQAEGKPCKRTVTVKRVKEIVKELPLIYDKKGEEHYNLISAFIKSLRGSDPDAAVYWLARMLEAGEDPLFIARRMVIFAAEDVGNADPQALTLAVSCKDAVHFVGRPEDFLPISQTAIYLANAPKSNSALVAYGNALKDVKKFGALPVPLHLRNAPTPLMRKLGYGKGYKYPHNFKGNWVDEEYLPEKLRGKRYYFPKSSGRERETEIKKKPHKKR
jgi:putative ATPase